MCHVAITSGYEVQGGMKFCAECGRVQALIVTRDQGSLTESVGTSMKATLLGLLLVVVTLAASCGGGGSGKALDIADSLILLISGGPRTLQSRD